MPRTAHVRPNGTIQVNFALDKDALAVLREEAPTVKSYGPFLARLLHEHRARREERQRWQQTGAHARAAVSVDAES
jgi:hypothetical protein